MSEVKIPKYIKEIMKRVRWTGIYEFKLTGTNRYRPSYGIFDDIDKLEKWAKRNGADFKVIHTSTRTNNYYIIFEMTDPVAHILHKQGLYK